MSTYINLLASLLDWCLAFAVDWLAGQYERDRRAVDARETERAAQVATLESARQSAQAEADRQHAAADRLARARASVGNYEGASPEDVAEAINRELAN